MATTPLLLSLHLLLLFLLTYTPQPTKAIPYHPRLSPPGIQIGPPVHVTNTQTPLRRRTTTLPPKHKPKDKNDWGTFPQLLDHSNPSLGTFPQRYWYGTEFYSGPGSPIVLLTPGEQSASGFNATFLSDQRLPGRFAREIGGAVVILEHRYWGQSSPFSELSVKNLRYLTLENAVRDLGYFAENFVLPDDHVDDSVNINGSSPGNGDAKSPWIFTGGSYAGALAAWSAVLDPGAFWAYHASSGVVQAVGHFWEYFSPVLEATPANCTRDLRRVVEFVDGVLVNGGDGEKEALKGRFGLGGLTDEDFAA